MAPDAVDVLKEFKALREVHLEYGDFDDRLLISLGGLQHLESLSIRSMKGITDKGLLHLGSLTGLKRFEVSDCDGISGGDIRSLRSVLPEALELK